MLTKQEIIKILCKKYGYTFERLANCTHAELWKLLLEEEYEEKNNEVDLYPNGRDHDAEDEDDL